MKVLNCQSLGDICKAMLDGEPVFLIRAQDKLALPIVKQYFELAKENKSMNMSRVLRIIENIQDWQEENPGKVRLPD